jgi:tetratricopeptide (TPR) repeat protein
LAATDVTAPKPDPLAGAPGAAEHALWITLVALAAARAAFTFVPGTWGWSLAAQRDLAPFWAWPVWALGALALLPPVGRALAPAAERLGGLLSRAPVVPFLGAASLAGILVLAFPDRVRFVGDALLRLRTLQVQGLIPTAWYPQALPLDLAIHHQLASALLQTLAIDAATPGRLIGAFDAAALALCAMAFASALELSGAAALACGAIVFWGGALTLFTGYNKAFAEMCVMVAACGVHAVRAARTGKGLERLGFTIAVAMLLHRSALALIPVGIAAWTIAARRASGRPSPARLALAAVAPVTAIAFMLPRIVRIVTHIDPMHFTPQTLGGETFLAGLFGGARPADLANLALFLVPLAPVVPVLAIASRSRLRRDEALVLAALALPFVLVMPFIHPGQGLFRDWDDFAATGTALAMVAAWLVGETLRSSPRAAPLAAAVVLATALPMLQWLAHHGDLPRGLDRVRRFVVEPPARIAFERAVTWQFVGQTEAERGRFEPSADAYAAAAALLPSPNVMRQWGVAELRAGRYARARDVYSGMVTRDSTDAFGWTGLALAERRLDDEAAADRAIGHAVTLDPEGRALRAMLQALAPADTSRTAP